MGGVLMVVCSASNSLSETGTRILAALEKSSFRVSGKGGAAELLGVSPGTLASRLKSLGIHKRDYRP
jgi:transcriptional regulator with GAF, ATPase, and Fis domain